MNLIAEQGAIVLIPFPYTDLSGKKTRPALIISNPSFIGNDLILCGITSQHSGLNEMQLTNKDLAKGELPFDSYVKYGKIVTLDKSLIKAVVAKVGENKIKDLLEKIRAIIG